MTNRHLYVRSNGTKLKEVVRKNKTLVKLRNKGINRKNVLSSGRALPSSKGHEHLYRLIELQVAYVWAKTSILTEETTKAQDRLDNIYKSHKRDPTRIDEVPNKHLLPQKIKILFAEVDAGNEILTALKQQYFRATGYEWRPKPDVNKPIKGIAKR